MLTPLRRRSRWPRFGIYKAASRALRASVGGGFLASLVTPAGRLWRPNRLVPICRASVERPTRGFSERKWELSGYIHQLVTGASVA